MMLVLNEAKNTVRIFDPNTGAQRWISLDSEEATAYKWSGIQVARMCGRTADWASKLTRIGLLTKFETGNGNVRKHSIANVVASQKRRDAILARERKDKMEQTAREKEARKAGKPVPHSYANGQGDMLAGMRERIAADVAAERENSDEGDDDGKIYPQRGMVAIFHERSSEAGRKRNAIRKRIRDKENATRSERRRLGLSEDYNGD